VDGDLWPVVLWRMRWPDNDIVVRCVVQREVMPGGFLVTVNVEGLDVRGFRYVGPIADVVAWAETARAIELEKGAVPVDG
jgi:hypothetical protein